MPSTQDPAVFVPTTTTDGQTDCFTPCACAQSKKEKQTPGGGNIVYNAGHLLHTYPPCPLYLPETKASILRKSVLDG